MAANGKHVDDEQLDREMVAMVRRVDTPEVADKLEQILCHLRELNDPYLRELVLEAINERFGRKE